MSYMCVLSALVRFSVNSRIKHGSQTGYIAMRAIIETVRQSSPHLVTQAALPGLSPLISALALVLFFLFNRTIWPQQGVHIINLENSHHFSDHPDPTSITLFGNFQSTRNGHRLLIFAGGDSSRRKGRATETKPALSFSYQNWLSPCHFDRLHYSVDHRRLHLDINWTSQQPVIRPFRQ